jgi:hypothetical protein
MAHPGADDGCYKPICGDIHNPADTYLPEITTPNPTTPRDSDAFSETGHDNPTIAVCKRGPNSMGPQCPRPPIGDATSLTSKRSTRLIGGTYIDREPGTRGRQIQERLRRSRQQ